MSKETDSYGKRGLFRQKEAYSGEKRPIDISIPEVRVSVKRDLFIWQKRPVRMEKEAY